MLGLGLLLAWRVVAILPLMWVMGGMNSSIPSAIQTGLAIFSFVFLLWWAIPAANWFNKTILLSYEFQKFEENLCKWWLTILVFGWLIMGIAGIWVFISR